MQLKPGIIISISLFFIFIALPGSGEQTGPPEKKGKIIFAESLHDFGDVMEGDIVKHTFEFRNEGPGALKLTGTKSSCGCTTAKTAFKEYGAGETGEMEISIDTRGKKGIVVKTVTVYMENAKNETHELNLVMKLHPPPHPKIENVLNINRDPVCKTCHLEKGAGQKGIFLYHRICAQCHGKKGRGASAMALNAPAWLSSIKDTLMKTIIAEGMPEKGMPSYVKGVTPALTDKQIDSLIEYIRSFKTGE